MAGQDQAEQPLQSDHLPDRLLGHGRGTQRQQTARGSCPGQLFVPAAPARQATSDAQAVGDPSLGSRHVRHPGRPVETGLGRREQAVPIKERIPRTSQRSDKDLSMRIPSFMYAKGSIRFFAGPYDVRAGLPKAQKTLRCFAAAVMTAIVVSPAASTVQSRRSPPGPDPATISENDLVSMVPTQGPDTTCACPACAKYVRWSRSAAKPNEIACSECKTVYPNAQYPADKTQVSLNFIGEKVPLKYYQGKAPSGGFGRPNPQRYFLSSPIDNAKYHWCKKAITSLAEKYTLTAAYHLTQRHRVAFGPTAGLGVFDDYFGEAANVQMACGGRGKAFRDCCTPPGGLCGPSRGRPCYLTWQV